MIWGCDKLSSQEGNTVVYDAIFQIAANLSLRGFIIIIFMDYY